MIDKSEVYAVYLARERDSQRWVCPDQVLLTTEQVEAMLASRETMLSRACRQFGFCAGSVFIKVVEVGSWWNSSQHGQVDRSFFRDERVQVQDTHEFRALSSSLAPPAGEPAPGAARPCGHKRADAAGG